MDPLVVITWTCVVLFVVTAIVAVLHVTGIYPLPNPRYGDTLFKVLIVEVAIIAVTSFGVHMKTPAQPPDPQVAESAETEPVAVENTPEDAPDSPTETTPINSSVIDTSATVSTTRATTRVVPPRNVVRPAILEYKVSRVDDQVAIAVNSHKVHSGKTLDWTAVPNNYISLGSNALRIEVYNNRSFTGGIKAFGGHKKEGWNYSVDFRSDGQNWHFEGGVSGEPPESQFGKWFIAKDVTFLVDRNSGRLNFRPN